MKVGTRCDEYGLYIPLMVFKSEVIGMTHDEIKNFIEKRIIEMSKEAKEKCEFLVTKISKTSNELA